MQQALVKAVVKGFLAGLQSRAKGSQEVQAGSPGSDCGQPS